MESEFGFGNRKVKISNHKLTRKSLTGDCQDLVQGDAEVQIQMEIEKALEL